MPNTQAPPDPEPDPKEVRLFPAKQALAQAGATEAVAVARATQEVQAAMVIAKRFPRDETAAFNRILQSCKRKTLAECACYAYPRGGTTVTGPSIRLAEALAQNWGNIDFGVVELDQREGESQVMAYAWDLETNTRQTKIFTVKHERRAGRENKRLDDPRDIYEMVANQGARRLRACILGVVPGDVVDAAVEACEKTMQTGAKEPLIDRVRKMVAAFAELAVPQEMIEARIGHKIDVTNETELVQLRKIFQSLRDGMSKREEWFKEIPTKPKMPGDDGDLGPQTKASAPTPPAYLAAVRSLLLMAHKTEADLINWLRNAGKVDESLSSLEQIAEMAPSALAFVHDNWKTVAKAL